MNDDACCLGFDSCKDNLGGCYAEAGWTGAPTGPFGYIVIGLLEGRVCDEGWRGKIKEREDVCETTVPFNSYTMLSMIF